MDEELEEVFGVTQDDLKENNLLNVSEMFTVYFTFVFSLTFSII